MLELREILKQNKVAKFLMYVFIYNFFTCQCLAMIPGEVFKENIKSLFNDVNNSIEDYNFALELNRSKRGEGYYLSVSRINNFGEQETKHLKGKNLGDSLDFGYGFIFPIEGEKICLGSSDYFNGFKSNVGVIVFNLKAKNGFSLVADTITIQENLTSMFYLMMNCNLLLNQGGIFSPSIVLNATKIENEGNIIGNNILADTNEVNLSKGSLIGGNDYLRIRANEVIEGNNSTIYGNNIDLITKKLGIENKSLLKAKSKLMIYGNDVKFRDSQLELEKEAKCFTGSFYNEGSEIFSGELNMFSNTFFNSGKIRSNSLDIVVNQEQTTFGSLSGDRGLKAFEFEGYDRRLGSFANVGEIISDELEISTEKYLINKGIIEAKRKYDLRSNEKLINSGIITQKKIGESTSIISSKSRIENKKGEIESARDLLVEGESFNNTEGKLKAKQLKMKLAIKEEQFVKNEKEELLLHSENNPYSERVQEYNRANKNTNKTKAEGNDDSSSKEDKKEEGKEESKKEVAQELGYLVNTKGVIEAKRNIEIKGSGAIYNAEGGEIIAKDGIYMNIYGRFLNQLGSKLLSHRAIIQSKGEIFNTGGSVMEGLLSFNCDGLKNGIGSKILGGLDITSYTSVCNMGEIINFGNPLQIITDFSIGNYGSILSEEKISFTAHKSVENMGNIASKSIELHVGTSDVKETNALPFSMQNGSITADSLIFECLATSPISSAVSLTDLVQNTGIMAKDVQFLFPNAIIENQSDSILNFRSTIFTKEFRNLALLRSLKQLKISASKYLINSASDSSLNPSLTNEKVSSFPLINDDDISKHKILNNLLEINEIDYATDKTQNNARIISDEDLIISSGGQVKNTGAIETKGHLSIKTPQLQNGWTYETKRHESLPELEFDYDYLEAQSSYIKARRGADIEADKFLNTFGTIDIVGGLKSKNSKGFINYAGDIGIRGDVEIDASIFANLIGTVRTNRADKRYWSLEFCNTDPGNLNVLDGALRINSPYAINSGSNLYATNGVFLNGVQNDQLSSIIDIASSGFGYTRMYTVNEYNRGQYADRILGMGYTATGQGAIIRADLNETVKKRILPASVSSSKKVVIDGYKDLKSNGIIHGESIKIKTGDGTTELGYTGEAILPSISGFAKKIEIYPYISSLAKESQFELANDADDFLFKSCAKDMKILFTIIGEEGIDYSKFKLPFSLEVLEVMLLKQMQKSLGTGYLSDMPSFLEATKTAYALSKNKTDINRFPHLKNYTDDEISIISEEESKSGLFFKPEKIGDYDVLVPELRLSPESVHSALLNPAGATVAQGNKDANVIIDTKGFLHATTSAHVDDNIKIKANRGALFETTTYDAMAITQNVTATTSHGGFLGMDSDTEYHKISEWHKIKRAREPMLATTSRGDFIIVIPDEESAEFKGMFADIGGNFEVHGGNCVLSPLEVASVVPCPQLFGGDLLGLFGGGANRISTMLPVFLKTVIKSSNDFFADVRVFKNTGSRIEAIGDVIINADEKIEFNTETRKFTLAEGMTVNEGMFTSTTQSRKVEDVVFEQPEVKAGGGIEFKSEDVYLTGLYETERDVKIKARLSKLESVLGYGTDEFYSKASNWISNASYERIATFARVAPTVFRSHGDFIADVAELYAEHSIEKVCRNERIKASKIDSRGLEAHEMVQERSSSRGFNILAPLPAVAPICDGNIKGAIDAFWKESSLLNATNALIHSKRGAEIAANGISTALSAYSSIKTILENGTGGFASLFGVGNFGFYNIKTSQTTWHDFTVGSTTIARENIDWNATSGDINITHRVAQSGGKQNYTAYGNIYVNPGKDETRTEGKTVSSNGTFNIFTSDLTLGRSEGRSSTDSTEYLASGFKSEGKNVFRAGGNISIVIPQIEGTRNVFDAMIVSIENKANEEKMQGSSSGATISTNLLKSGVGTFGMNYGASNSYNQYLNEAYIRGAVDFKKSEVRNKGCLVMDIENAGASYQYIPGDEVHETNNFAIGLSGLNLTSPDAFAYSLGRSTEAISVQV